MTSSNGPGKARDMGWTGVGVWVDHRKAVVVAVTGHLAVYYDAVIACIRGASSILIFGPGEAKDELKKRLDEVKLGGRVEAVQTVDKMTAPQIAAKVRKHFSGRTPAAPRRKR